MKKQHWYNLSYFCVLAFVLFFLMNEVLHSPLNVGHDTDYLLIADSDLAQPQDSSQYDFLSYMNKYPNKRFNPLSNIISWGIASIFNGNATYISYCMYLFSLATTWLFYLFLIRIRISHIVSFLVSLLFITSLHNEMWWLLGANETFGLFFLLLALICFTNTKNRNYSVFGCISIALSALCKESFWILLPIISTWLIVYNSSQNDENIMVSFRKKLRVHVFIFSIFILIGIRLAFIALYGHLWGSERDYNTFSLAVSNFRTLISHAILWLPVLVMSILVIVKKVTVRNRFILYAVMLHFSWIISQLIIHKDAPIHYNRYLIPGQFSSYIIAAYAFNRILNLGFKKIAISISIALIISFSYQSKNMYINCSYYANQGIAYNNLLDYVAEKTPQNIIIVTDEKSHYGFANSTLVYLKNRKIQPNVIEFKYDEEGIDNFKSLLNEQSDPLVIVATPKESTDVGDEIGFLFSDAHIFSRDYFNKGIKDMLNSKDLSIKSVSYVAFEGVQIQ
jgi:hypothetical protein